MASHHSNRKSSSAVLVSSASTHRNSQAPRHGIPAASPQLEGPLVHTISSTQVHCLPEENLETQHHQFFGNKVTLCFEEEFSLSDVREWVTCFNQKSDIPLTIVDALPLALFVVLFDVEDPHSAKLALLSTSPLKANEVYASVNEFIEGVDPCNLPDFKHLVTVNIPQGTREILRCIKFVVAIIGKFVKARLVPRTIHQLISVVVESKLKLFPAQGFFS